MQSASFAHMTSESSNSSGGSLSSWKTAPNLLTARITGRVSTRGGDDYKGITKREPAVCRFPFRFFKSYGCVMIVEGVSCAFFFATALLTLRLTILVCFIYDAMNNAIKRTAIIIE